MSRLPYNTSQTKYRPSLYKLRIIGIGEQFLYNRIKVRL